MKKYNILFPKIRLSISWLKVPYIFYRNFEISALNKLTAEYFKRHKFTAEYVRGITQKFIFTKKYPRIYWRTFFCHTDPTHVFYAQTKSHMAKRQFWQLRRKVYPKVFYCMICAHFPNFCSIFSRPNIPNFTKLTQKNALFFRPKIGTSII